MDNFNIHTAAPTALVKPSTTPAALIKPNAAPTALVKPNAAPAALVKPNALPILTKLLEEINMYQLENMIKDNNIPAIDNLLNDHKKNIDQRHKLRDMFINPLQLTIIYNDVQAMKIVLKHGANLLMLDRYDNNVLHLCIVFNSINCFKYILYKISTDYLFKINNHKLNVLECIVHFDRVKFLDILCLDNKLKKIIINYKNNHDRNLLHLSVIYNKINIALALFNHYESLNAVQLAKLQPAPCKDSLAPTLLNSILEDVDKDKNTVLHLCCIFNNIDILRIIIKKKSGINNANKYNYTPIHCAIFNNNLDILSLLLKNGASPDWNDNYIGRTVLYKTKKFHEIALMLHSYGAKNIFDKN